MANAKPVTQPDQGEPKKADDIQMPPAPPVAAKAKPAEVDKEALKAIQDEALAEGKVAILADRHVRVDN